MVSAQHGSWLILASKTNLKCPLDGIGSLVAESHVHSEVDLGHTQAIG